MTTLAASNFESEAHGNDYQTTLQDHDIPGLIIPTFHLAPVTTTDDYLTAQMQATTSPANVYPQSQSLPMPTDSSHPLLPSFFHSHEMGLSYISEQTLQESSLFPNHLDSIIPANFSEQPIPASYTSPPSFNFYQPPLLTNTAAANYSLLNTSEVSMFEIFRSHFCVIILDASRSFSFWQSIPSN